MSFAVLAPPSSPESVFEAGRRLAELLDQAEKDSVAGQLTEPLRIRIADVVEALRIRVARKSGIHDRCSISTSI